MILFSAGASLVDAPVAAAADRRPGPDPAGWPSVGVVIVGAGRDRSGSGRDAGPGPACATTVDTVVAQEYPGPLRVVIVHDGPLAGGAAREGSPPGGGGQRRPVTVLANWRSPGVAGARNSGILALDSDLVALCTDGDGWHPGKLTAQVQALQAVPGAEFVTCASENGRAGYRTPRLAGRTRVDLADLTRSPMGALLASGFLIRRGPLCAPDELGLFAEDPAGHAALDWDLLLRAARRTQIVHVDAALVRRGTAPPATPRRRYDDRAAALRWMLARHPDVPGTGPAVAWLFARYACHAAVVGDMSDAGAFGRAAVHRCWRPVTRHNGVRGTR